MSDNCTFCEPANFEDSLVVETRDYWVVATLGQIRSGYVLIIPKKHISCMGALSHEDAASMNFMTHVASRALSQEYHRSLSHAPYPVIAFEHGIVGQTIKHAHLHLLPVVVDLTARIRFDFPQAMIEELRDVIDLRERYERQSVPYLFWTTRSGSKMVCWDPPAPPQYLRLIMAELLGLPERGNWRNMDPELDKRLRQGTVARLKPYFP